MWNVGSHPDPAPDDPAPGAVPTRPERVGPPAGATRREDVPSATRRENVPHPTRREAAEPRPVAPADSAPGGLSPELTARLTGCTPMRTTGGEAQLWRVRDSAHQDAERVLKVYLPQIEPDPAVLAQLTAIRSRHIVTIVEVGTLADGRFFELMEYLPGGSLRSHGAGRLPFDQGSVTEIVRQLADGLATLHGHGITHRDLKPDNVLVRTGPNEMVLTDFGLSRNLDSSVRFTTAARTSAYAAPEAWAGHVSPARDWWSLGIMVLELVTGQRPFAGLDERMIQVAVTTRPVPVDAITDPRLGLLCAGLLVADDKKRWNGEQVRDWLAGGSPAVPDRRVPIDVTSFEFGGQRYVDPESLAVAMARDWRRAARNFGISPSPSWTALTTWLHQFDDPDRSPAGVVEVRLDLLNQLERSREQPNAKLVRLLAGLNPRQPPVYRQAHVDVPRLRQLARTAQDESPGNPGTARAREIIGELWSGRLLAVLARFDGGAQLDQVGGRWATLVGELNAAVTVLKRNPRLASAFSRRTHRPGALAAMLELAGGAPRGDDWVREIRDRADALPVPVDWYADIVRWAGDDPVRAYAALYASGVAMAEAQQAEIDRRAAEQARLAREQAWADHEQRRLAGRGGALRIAALTATTLAGLWLLAALFANKSPWLLLVAVAAGTHFFAECWLADQLGADYHPTYSLRQTLREAAGRIGVRMRNAPGRWALGIGLAILAVAITAWLLPIVAVGATAAHLAWTVVRHRRWTAAHDAEHQRALTP